jgi:uncharacterized protein
MIDLISGLLFICIGIAAGFVGGVAGGGGGLISVPAMIFAGLPANMAIATNRFGCFGYGVSSTYKLHKSKNIMYKHVIPLTIFGVAGALVGTKILIDINAELLSKIVGILLIIALGSIFINPKFGLKEHILSKGRAWLTYAAYFGVGVYDGFFGVAGGIFSMLLIVHGLKTTFLKAHGTDNIPWFIGLLITMPILFFNGLIDVPIAIMLIIGMFIGGWIGSHTAIKKGNKFVKFVFALVVIASAIKLLFF